MSRESAFVINILAVVATPRLHIIERNCAIRLQFIGMPEGRRSGRREKPGMPLDCSILEQEFIACGVTGLQQYHVETEREVGAESAAAAIRRFCITKVEVGEAEFGIFKTHAIIWFNWGI